MGVRPAIARCNFARVMVVVFVALTAAVALVWGHEKLMSQDEMYAFQTDSVASVARLVQVQREWPISLDPLLMHLLSHGAMKVFGVGAFALRFPALVGFLLMQVCLFFFVRNLAGERAGMVAAAFPAMTGTLFYAAEGRPYGVMLGTYALALLCWQVAVRRESGRGLALVGLAAAIAATVNAHYFGVLLLVPVGAAEAYRTWRRRAVDWPVVASICVGTAGFVGAVPFLKGAGEFKKHYYNAGTVGLHDITRAYRSIFLDYTKKSMAIQHVAMVVLVVFAVALVWGCVRAVGRQKQEQQKKQIPFGDDNQKDNNQKGNDNGEVVAAEWVVVLALAGLPFCGYLLARFVTHSIEVRYVLGAVVAISAMVGVAVSEWVRRDGVFSAVVGVMLVGVIGIGAMEVRAERRASAATMAALMLPPEVKRALDRGPDGRLYIQDMGRFEVASYYADAETRARLALVYSSNEELAWNGHDTMALTAEHLQHFTALRVVRYEELRRVPGEHVFVMFHTGWDWTDQAFGKDEARVRPVGTAMEGDVAAVSFSGE